MTSNRCRAPAPNFETCQDSKTRNSQPSHLSIHLKSSGSFCAPSFPCSSQLIFFFSNIDQVRGAGMRFRGVTFSKLSAGCGVAVMKKKKCYFNSARPVSFPRVIFSLRSKIYARNLKTDKFGLTSNVQNFDSRARARKRALDDITLTKTPIPFSPSQ